MGGSDNHHDHQLIQDLGGTGRDLADLVYRDDLTLLLNRRFLYPFVQKQLPQTPGAPPFTLVMMDLDFFKKVNDTHGHLAGDRVLKGLAERIKTAVRQGERVVRYAGDEFMLLMPATSKHDAARIAERLRHDVEATPFVLGDDGRTTSLTLSVGIAEAPTDGKTVPELIEAADRAMYAAKQTGRNRVCIAGETAARTQVARDRLDGFPCPKLIGRSMVLARCEALSNLGERGPTTLTIVQGEGGLGKTRVLQEMARRRSEGGHLVLWATCREEIQAVPYAPLTEALRRRIKEDPLLLGEVGSFLSEQDRVALSQRLPELAPEAGAAGSEDTREQRTQLFTALVAVLRYLGRERQLCLVADDLQYADAATLKVIAYLLRHERQGSRGAGLPIFASVATDAVEGETPWVLFRRAVERVATVGTAELEPLGEADVGEMIDACFSGHGFPKDLGQKVWEVTGGSPLLVEEVLILLTLSGFLVQQGNTWRLERRANLTMPDSLGDMLMAHLGKLDDETSRAVLRASVTGSQFSVDLLRRVLDINEGRATQITDKAVRYRLLRDGDPATLEDFRFANRKLQKLTYDTIGDDLRKETHHKVADVKEQHPGVDLDRALGEIAHHYEQSGDVRRAATARAKQTESAQRVFREGEAATYVESAGALATPRIEVDIPEATHALDEPLLARIPVVFRSLAAVRRGVQMYPPGSRYIATAVESCISAVRALLTKTPSFTLKERAGKFEVNGRPIDTEPWGPTGPQVLEDFRRSRVHSVTFTRTVEPRDIEALAVGMLRFGEIDARGEWRDFLADRACTGIGVVPKRYRATGGGEAPLDGELEGLAKESTKHLPLLHQILRYTAGAAEAVQLYPRGSETVSLAIAGLVRSLAATHEVLRTVNLGVTADGFLVNDLRLDSRTYSASVQAMRDIFARAGVRSLSFHRGVEAAEVEILFRDLEGRRAAPTDALDWQERLRQIGVRHIGIDEYEFVAADAEGGHTEDVRKTAAEKKRLDQKTLLARILAGPPAELMSDDARAALPEIVTDLVIDDELEPLRQVVDKLFQNLQAREPTVRSRAIELAESLAEGTSQVVGESIVQHCAPHLASALREERSPEPLHRLCALGEKVVLHLVRRGDLQTASRILWALGKALQVDPEVTAEVRLRSEQAVARVMSTEAFERALATLWTPNERRRTLALHLLEGCGRAAVDRLVQLVLESPDDEARRIHAAQLRAVADPVTLGEQLAALITPYQTPARLRNLLRGAEALAKDPLPILVRAFLHPDEGVIAEAVSLLRRIAPEDRRRVLSALLSMTDETLRQRAVSLLGELGPPDAAVELLPLLGQKGLSVELVRDVCLALGRLGDARAVLPLGKLLESTRWSRFLRRDPPSEVRVAAVWALGSIKGDRARQLVMRAREDRDAMVGKVAQALLAAGG